MNYIRKRLSRVKGSKAKANHHASEFLGDAVDPPLSSRRTRPGRATEVILCGPSPEGFNPAHVPTHVVATGPSTTGIDLHLNNTGSDVSGDEVASDFEWETVDSPLTSKHTGPGTGDSDESVGPASVDIGNQGTLPNTPLIVAAFDFGTTYSGYAYSLRDEFKKDPLKIYTNNSAIGCSNAGLVTIKMPTVVLFNKSKEFHSFGYQAETKYAQLAEDEEHIGWRYYSRFKMILHSNRTQRLMALKLKDDQGQTMLAIDVFSAAIAYMKQDFLKMINDRVPGIRDTDVGWVLTVPAIWEEGAKQFMRNAAEKAGIPGELLTLALEPESAAVFCKEVAIHMEKKSDGLSFISAFKTGTPYMLLDLGGGTVDISVQEVQEDGCIAQLTAPSGGPWGGVNVDKTFLEFLETLCSKEVIQELKTKSEYKSDYIDIQRCFELKKRAIASSTQSDEVILKLPPSLITIHRAIRKKDLTDSINDNGFKEQLRQKGDKLRIKPTFLAEMFDTPVSQIIEHVTWLLRDPELSAVKTLMLVGGFSGSEIVKEKIKKAFPSYTVISPQDPELAVLKGAVIYGFKPGTITSRKNKYSYGVNTYVNFDRRIHKASKKVCRDGVNMCDDVFKSFITAGETVIPDKTFAEHPLAAPSRRSTSASIEVYKTLKRTPQYVDDDGCHLLGKIHLSLLGYAGGAFGTRGIVKVRMHFGDTELKVTATEEGTNNQVNVRFSCA